MSISEGPSDQGAIRTQKIARMKASKAAKERLAILGAQMAKADDDEDDGRDELEREHVLLSLQCATHVALDSLRAVVQEMEMLEQIEKMRRPDGSLPPPPPKSDEDEAAQGLQMLTLMPEGGSVDTTATGLNAGALRSVGGGGRLSYATAMKQLHTGVIPGLYTYSVEEGLRQEEADRAMAEVAKQRQKDEQRDSTLRRKKEEEGGYSDEDDEELQKQRAKDDWRDTHTRGYGNRMNRN